MSKKICPSCHCVHWLETEECGHCYVQKKSSADKSPRESSMGREVVDSWDIKHFGRTPVAMNALQHRVREDLIAMIDSAYLAVKQELEAARAENNRLTYELDKSRDSHCKIIATQEKQLADAQAQIESLSKFSEHTFKIESHDLEVTIRSRGIDIFAVKNTKGVPT